MQYVDEKRASELTGLSVAWFQRARWEGTGPPYAKLQKAVRYSLKDLEIWMEENKVSSN